MRDRISTYPYRRLITPETGPAFYAKIERSDGPLEPGTPLNKVTLLDDDTATDLELFGDDATPNKAFAILAQHIKGLIPGEEGVHGLRFFEDALQWSDGTDWHDVPTGPPQIKVTLIKASGTFTVPKTKPYRIICVSGGQGGQGGQGGSSGNSTGDNSRAGQGGKGGDSGRIIQQDFMLTAEQTYACIIGAGGAGTSGSPYATQGLIANIPALGAVGGNTSFGSLLTTANVTWTIPYSEGGAGGAQGPDMDTPGSAGANGASDTPSGFPLPPEIPYSAGGIGGVGGDINPGSQINRPRAGGGGGGGAGGLYGIGGAGGYSSGFAAGGGGGGGGSGPFGNTSAGAGGNGRAGSAGCIFIIENWM